MRRVHPQMCPSFLDTEVEGETVVQYCNSAPLK